MSRTNMVDLTVKASFPRVSGDEPSGHGGIRLN